MCRDSLQCSACLKWVHFLCFSLTLADFCIICATGTAVGWHCPACCLQSQTGSPTQTSSTVTTSASPPSGFLPPGFYQPRRPRGPLRYPCSMCSDEVGKDSLKGFNCSKWVHFCSSLTRANFRKICVAGSTVDWNCPTCLNGYLASPTHQQVSPRPVSPTPTPPTPPSPTCSNLKDSSLPLPSHPPLLNFSTRIESFPLHLPGQLLSWYVVSRPNFYSVSINLGRLPKEKASRPNHFEIC